VGGGRATTGDSDVLGPIEFLMLMGSGPVMVLGFLVGKKIENRKLGAWRL
jgi:hypothetical protein